MNVTAFLIISKSGHVRVNKTGTGSSPTDLTLKLAIKIPESFFKRPVPVVTIDVPNEILAGLETPTVVRMTAQTVATALDVNVEDVVDGLNVALAHRKSRAGN